MFFVLDLVNPAYFESDGFLGTWNGVDGILNSKPAGFDALDINSVIPVAPKTVKDLEITFQ